MRNFYSLSGLSLALLIAVNTYSQELKPNPDLEDVIVVFKTHFDIGYTDFAESVVRKYGLSMIEGSWNTRFYIWSIDGYENEKDLITPSEEFRMPLKSSFSEESTGHLPPYKQGISLSDKGVLLTAFGPNPDGEGILLRLWEQAGDSGECMVK